MSTDETSKYPTGPRKSWGTYMREEKAAAKAGVGAVPGEPKLNRAQRRAIRAIRRGMQ